MTRHRDGASRHSCSGAGTNPEQLFAAGYAACFASAMGVAAHKLKLDASRDSVSADVGLKGSAGAGFRLDVRGNTGPDLRRQVGARASGPVASLKYLVH